MINYLSFRCRIRKAAKQSEIIFMYMMCIGILAAPLILSISSGLAEEKELFNNIVERDGSFLKLSNGIVVDQQNHLMWAQADNGYDISIQDARGYIDRLNLGGHTNWRLPTIQELETLLVHDKANPTPPGQGCSGNYQIHRFFKLTCCCPWALQDNGTRPASYPFIKRIATGSMWHHKSDTLGNRVLPVRDLD